jgi:hypothetical protein
VRVEKVKLVNKDHSVEKLSLGEKQTNVPVSEAEHDVREVVDVRVVF